MLRKRLWNTEVAFGWRSTLLQKQARSFDPVESCGHLWSSHCKLQKKTRITDQESCLSISTRDVCSFLLEIPLSPLIPLKLLGPKPSFHWWNWGTIPRSWTPSALVNGSSSRLSAKKSKVRWSMGSANGKCFHCIQFMTAWKVVLANANEKAALILDMVRCWDSVRLMRHSMWDSFDHQARGPVRQTHFASKASLYYQGVYHQNPWDIRTVQHTLRLFIFHLILFFGRSPWSLRKAGPQGTVLLCLDRGLEGLGTWIKQWKQMAVTCCQESPELVKSSECLSCTLGHAHLAILNVVAANPFPSRVPNWAMFPVPNWPLSPPEEQKLNHARNSHPQTLISPNIPISKKSEHCRETPTSWALSERSSRREKWLLFSPSKYDNLAGFRVPRIQWPGWHL